MMDYRTKIMGKNIFLNNLIKKGKKPHKIHGHQNKNNTISCKNTTGKNKGREEIVRLEHEL